MTNSYMVNTLCFERIFHSVGSSGFIHVRTLHKLLEWENFGVKWESETKAWDQLLPTLLKRSNEASGLYQMFQSLCDVAIIDRENQTFTYLEEFPLYLIDKLREKTGHDFDADRHDLVILSLEYGANFSKVGEDHFGEGRAHGSVDDAHQSNFLHPVVYYYRDIPTDGQIKARDRYKETLPKPDGIHHVLEDFTTVFDGPTTHILPLRRFLEFFLDEDLRIFLAERDETQITPSTSLNE